MRRISYDVKMKSYMLTNDPTAEKEPQLAEDMLSPGIIMASVDDVSDGLSFPQHADKDSSQLNNCMQELMKEKLAEGCKNPDGSLRDFPKNYADWELIGVDARTYRITFYFRNKKLKDASGAVLVESVHIICESLPNDIIITFTCPMWEDNRVEIVLGPSTFVTITEHEDKKHRKITLFGHNSGLNSCQARIEEFS